MPLTKQDQAIPNRPLNGRELATYMEGALDQELKQRGVLTESQRGTVIESMRTALFNDCYFREAQIYRNPSASIAFSTHLCGDLWAFSLEPTIVQSNPILPKIQPFIRRPVGVPAPPLDAQPRDKFFNLEENIVDAFTMTMRVTNPNLVRVHFSIPIRLTVEKPQKPGSMFKEFDYKVITYPKEGDKPLPQPEVFDQTADYLQKWNLFPDPKQIEAPAEPEVETLEVETVSVGPLNRAERRAQRK